jgi:hypothetical protein
MDFGRGHKLGDDGADVGFSILRQAGICCGGYATVAFEKVENPSTLSHWRHPYARATAASRYAIISGWGLPGRETT